MDQHYLLGLIPKVSFPEDPLYNVLYKYTVLGTLFLLLAVGHCNIVCRVVHAWPWMRLQL